MTDKKADNNVNHLPNEQNYNKLVLADDKISPNKEDAEKVETKDDLHDSESVDVGSSACFGLNVTPLILMLSLAFHALFEGIALGLSESYAGYV
jgi:hypothetical protein